MRYDGTDRLYTRSLIENPAAVVSLDGFERARVAEPQSLFDSQFQYDLAPYVWEPITATGGTVTHGAALCAAVLTVTGTNGSSAALQTYQHFRYNPGRAQEIIMTFRLGAAVANVRKRVGYFNANDGIFLEQNGTTDLAFVRRNSATGGGGDNRVVQADWNLDKLDGTGPSGITLDLSKTQILYISAQWLGVGRLRVGFDIAGVIVFAHEFLAANALTTVYTRTFNLPVRYEMTSTAASAGATMDCLCASVATLGPFSTESVGYHWAGRNTADVSVGTGGTALLAIRPALTFNSIANRGTIIPEEVFVLCGSNPIMVDILINPTVTGGAWGALTASSITEINTTPASFTGGEIITSFPVPAGSGTNREAGSRELNNRFPITLDSAGAVRGILGVRAATTSGTSACRAAINLREIR